MAANDMFGSLHERTHDVRVSTLGARGLPDPVLHAVPADGLARAVTVCRASGGPLRDVLDLGPIPLNAFPGPGDPAPPRVPLTLAVNDTSGLVQLRHTVDPDLLYRRYWYRSGLNETMRAHLADLATDATRWARLTSGDTVVDIGCNDGTTLRAFPHWVNKVGFDPSNVVPDGVDVFINDYFSLDSGWNPFLGPVKLVTSVAMLYDVADPVGFAKQIARLLADDGLWVTEQHYLGDMLATNDYSVICHEHLLVLSLRSIEYILNKAGLQVAHVSRNPTNGGSFRLYIQKQARPSASVRAMRHQEKLIDLDRFANAVKQNREATLALLTGLRARGNTIGALGASTKFNTVLAYCGIGPELITCVGERSPEKVGRTTVTGIPIVSEEDARDFRPDYFVIGPWHFLGSITKREAAYLEAGGHFIVLFPYPRIVA